MTDEKVPIINGPYGQTTEWARRQACINMKRYPEVMKRMIDTFGEARIRRDYPEVFAEDGDEL
jgi:hypothetical protein